MEPGSPGLQADSLLSEPPGKPKHIRLDFLVGNPSKNGQLIFNKGAIGLSTDFINMTPKAHRHVGLCQKTSEQLRKQTLIKKTYGVGENICKPYI